MPLSNSTAATLFVQESRNVAKILSLHRTRTQCLRPKSDVDFNLNNRNNNSLLLNHCEYTLQKFKLKINVFKCSEQLI